MQGTILALLPPLLAIIISLKTKKVNLSLFLGIICGLLIFTKGDIFLATTHFMSLAAEKVSGNIGVIIFIILLGMIVYLMNLSGATHRYAQWASEKIKTKKQSLFVTWLLGLIIFVDDYFNCLTVGTVMKPITDKFKVSRERLAYIIDCTAAPICIIAPISSWAAAVSSYLPEGTGIDGFKLFMKSIICNYYSLFTILLVLLTIIFNVNFGKMKKYEELAEKKAIKKEKIENEDNGNGKVIDLILPIISIIFFSILSMLYTGGLFEGSNIKDAFANCDAILGLAMGALYTIFFVALLYLPRKIVTPQQFSDGLIEGFKNMVPATLILVLAWVLGGVCSGDYLNAGGYVYDVITKYNISLEIIPAIFFVVSLLLAFSTGTSWGTFAILLPIVISIFPNEMSTIMVLSTAAVLGGSVCGDHISPISDTTILSSTGADCEHINHVESQMQYGLLVAVITFISYLISGFTKNNLIGLITGIVLLIVTVLILKSDNKKEETN